MKMARNWESWAPGALAGPAQGVPTLPERPAWQRAIEAIVPAAAAIYQQRELARLNRIRMERGMPAITAPEFARDFMPPAARVEVGPSPQARQMMTFAAIGGVALLAVLLLRK